MASIGAEASTNWCVFVFLLVSPPLQRKSKIGGSASQRSSPVSAAKLAWGSKMWTSMVPGLVSGEPGHPKHGSVSSRWAGSGPLTDTPSQLDRR